MTGATAVRAAAIHLRQCVLLNTPTCYTPTAVCAAATHLQHLRRSYFPWLYLVCSIIAPVLLLPLEGIVAQVATLQSLLSLLLKAIMCVVWTRARELQTNTQSR